MKINQDDNKFVQKPIYTGRVEICKSRFNNHLRRFTRPIRSVAHRETPVTCCQLVIYNPQNTNFLPIDPLRVSTYFAQSCCHKPLFLTLTKNLNSA